MLLNDLEKIKPVTKLKPICREAGINYNTLRSWIERGSPELSDEDAKKFLRVLKKYYNWIGEK